MSMLNVRHFATLLFAFPTLPVLRTTGVTLPLDTLHTWGV